MGILDGVALNNSRCGSVRIVVKVKLQLAVNNGVNTRLVIIGA